MPTGPKPHPKPQGFRLACTGPGARCALPRSCWAECRRHAGLECYVPNASRKAANIPAKRGRR